MKFRMRKMIDYVKKSIHRMTILVLLFVISCIVIPVLYFMQSVYSDSTELFENILIKTIQTETDSYAKLLEKEFEILNKQMYSLTSDEIIDSLRVKFEMGKFDIYLSSQLQQVQSHMQTIVNCHSIVNDMAMYYPGELREISLNSQRKYYDRAEKLEKIVNESNYGNYWNDSDKVVIWNSEDYSTEYHNLSVIIVSEITKKSMKAYFDTYKKNGEAIWAICVKTGETDEFFVSSDTLLRRERLPDELLPGEYTILTIDEKDYLLTCAEFQEGMIFYQLLPFDNVTVILEEYRGILNFLTMILVCFVFLFLFIFYRMISRPIEHAKQTFMRMENGELGVQMGKTWCIEFQEMYDRFDSMSKRIQHLIGQEYQLRLLNTKAQMKQLQYQINPHFLYNSYFTLYGLMQDMDYENAEKMAELMGKYLKYITVSGDDAATLEDELEHALAYAQIQNLRFSNRICICFEECSDCLKGREVPRLIVQPLIENAFNHGVKDRIHGGMIQVKISGFGNTIKISVEDNGGGLTEEKLCALEELLCHKEEVSGDSVALLNIHRRLVLQYEAGSGLYVSRSKLGGLLCELLIIMKEGDADEKDPGS